MIEETPGYIGFYKGLHYKVGIHSKVFNWDCGEWVRSDFTQAELNKLMKKRETA